MPTFTCGEHFLSVVINAFIKNKLCTRCTLVNCEGQELVRHTLRQGDTTPMQGAATLPLVLIIKDLTCYQFFDERDGDVSDAEGKLTLCVPFEAVGLQVGLVRCFMRCA